MLHGEDKSGIFLWLSRMPAGGPLWVPHPLSAHTQSLTLLSFKVSTLVYSSLEAEYMWVSQTMAGSFLLLL